MDYAGDVCCSSTDLGFLFWGESWTVGLGLVGGGGGGEWLV